MVSEVVCEISVGRRKKDLNCMKNYSRKNIREPERDSLVFSVAGTEC